jgi:hypothetical protein
MVNEDIMGVVVWLVVMCVTGGLLFVIWESDAMLHGVSTMWYLGTEPVDFGVFFRMTCRFFLIMYQVRAWCLPGASLMRPSCLPHASLMPPSCLPHASLMPPSCLPHASQ